MAKTCAAKFLWIAVSDGDQKTYPGMQKVVEALQKAGARCTTAVLDAKAPLEAQNRVIEDLQRDPANIRLLVFAHHSVVPEGVENTPLSNHIWTLHAAYSLTALCRSLFNRKDTYE